MVGGWVSNRRERENNPYNFFCSHTGIDRIVVAANLQKIVDEPQRFDDNGILFKLNSGSSTENNEPIDEKQLIGFAQIKIDTKWLCMYLLVGTKK